MCVGLHAMWSDSTEGCWGTGVIQAGAAARTSAEPLPEAFCFQRRGREILSLASVECYLPPPPQVCCPLCCLWGLSGSWTPAWVEQNSSSSHQVVVWIVVFFLSFSSQKASSRCGLLVNSWSQVVMGELFLSIYTTQCKKLWFWNTLCKDCKKKCPHLSHTKALLEKPFAMCRAERN